jgi:tetratricopeptide (TPR) repeat protein
LERAAQAHAPNDLVVTILGISQVHSDIDQATASLNQALEDNPDNHTALCALTWAYYVAGRYDQMSMLNERLAHTGSHDLNDYARLLLAQTRLYGALEPKQLIEDLDGIIARHPRWGMAYAVRAEAKDQLGQLTKSFDTLLDAADDADKARRLLPDSPCAWAASMAVYNYIIQLGRHQGVQVAEFEQRAASIAEELGRWPTHKEGRMRRGLYYKLMGQTDRFEMEYRELLAQKMGAPQPELADRLQRDDPAALVQFVKKNQHRPAAGIVLAIRDVVDGNEAQALSRLEELAEKYTVTDFRGLMLDILRLARRREQAKQFAQQTLDQLPPYGNPTFWRWELFGIQYTAGELDEKELLDRAGPFHWEGCAAHFYVGVDALSLGDTEKAKEHLQIAHDCAAPGWWMPTLSGAYLRLVEQGKLPVAGTVPQR